MDGCTTHQMDLVLVHASTSETLSEEARRHDNLAGADAMSPVQESCIASAIGYGCSAWDMALARAALMAKCYVPAPSLTPFEPRSQVKSMKQERKQLDGSRYGCQRWILQSHFFAKETHLRRFTAEVTQSRQSQPRPWELGYKKKVDIPPPPSRILYSARRSARKYHIGKCARLALAEVASSEQVFIYSHGEVWLCSGKAPYSSVWCKSALEESAKTCKQCNRKTGLRHGLLNGHSVYICQCGCLSHPPAPRQAGSWQIR